MIKVKARSAATLAIVLCLGVRVFWLIVRAFANELDPLASFASLIRIALAFGIAVTMVVDTTVTSRKT
jgi:hypothetical protein